jgi:hypothetical protein
MFDFHENKTYFKEAPQNSMMLDLSVSLPYDPTCEENITCFNWHRCQDVQQRIPPSWIEKVTIGNYEKVAKVGKWVIPLQSLTVKEDIDVASSVFRCDPLSDLSMNCTETQCKGSSFCSGDELFCSHYVCSRSPICACHIMIPIKVMKVLVEDKWVTPSCVGIQMTGHPEVYRRHKRDTQPVDTEKTVPEVPCSGNCILEETYSTVYCETCEIICSSTGFHVMSLISFNNVKVCMEGACQRWKVAFTHYFTAPRLNDLRRHAMRDVEVSFQLEFMGGGIGNVSKTCSGIPFCDTIECTICLEAWTHPLCMRWWQWFLMTVCFYLVSGYLFYVLYFPFLISRALYNIVNYLYIRTSLQANQTEIRSSVTSRSPSGRPKYILPYLVCLLLIASQTVDAQSFTVSHAQKCIVSDGVRNCTSFSSNRIILKPVGEEATMEFVSDTGDQIASMSIWMQALELTCLKETAYYTTNVEPSCDSYSSCNFMSHCNCDEDSDGRLQAHNQFYSFKDSFGDEQCLTMCGALCGCRLANWACAYVRHSLIPLNRIVYRVVRCPEWVLSSQVMIRIKSTGGMVNIEQPLRLMPGVAETFSDVSVMMISDQKPVQDKIQSCFLMKNQEIFMSECSPKGILSLGMPGEIQCETFESALNVDRTCKVAQGLLQKDHTTDKVVCTVKQFMLESLKEKKLPQEFNTISIFKDGDHIIANVTSFGSVQIQVDVKNLTILSIEQEATCNFIFNKIEGCHSCDLGAKIIIDSMCDKDSVAMTLICKEHPEFSFSAVTKSGKTTLSKTVKTSKGSISDECMMTWGKKQQKVSINGSLDKGAEVDPYEQFNSTSFSTVNETSIWDKFSFLIEPYEKFVEFCIDFSLKSILIKVGLIIGTLIIIILGFKFHREIYSNSVGKILNLIMKDKKTI